MIVGTISVALGILGIFLPLLPTTPFLLLASACYIRSSERLYHWLMGNKYLGPYIRNIKDRRGMPFRAKVYTIALLWVSLLFSIYRIDKTSLDILLLITGICTSTFILRLRTLRD
jgi:uncharacterized protein